MEDGLSDVCAAKLAADLWIWVDWLENDILELYEAKRQGNETKSRLAMAWRQNRWYYEMVYEQIFGVERPDIDAKMRQKRAELKVLIEKSKNFVEQKMKQKKEKIRIEMRDKKIERLNTTNGAETPPNGTIDREWYEIRKYSQQIGKVAQKWTKLDELSFPDIDGWLEERHYAMLKRLLRKNEKFREKFLESNFFMCK